MKSLIIANWKMNPTSQDEAERMIIETERLESEGCEVVLCPPFVFLNKTTILKNVKVGAQNCSFDDAGPFTGEISPKMLKEMGVDYVILGHSERRSSFNEDDNIINRKVQQALRNGLSVILCVGETEKEREEGKTDDVLQRQLAKLNSNLIVAYEPVWAIGSGRSCDPKTAEKARLLIEKIAKPKRVIYGGSVNSSNAGDYISSFSGLLIGGSSLDIIEFGKILKVVQGV